MNAIDAWNIQSVLTVLKAGGDYELATVDIDVFPWIDGNENQAGEPSVRRFELNLLL